METKQDIIRGRYKPIREISRGGMGVVYLAKDLLKNKDVAVKKSFFSGAKQAEQAFELEAKLLARLEHPGLPKVLDYFFGENNVQTLVMDFIVGETLEDVLESGKSRVGRGLDSARVTDWALQILDILRYLHNFEPPVVHRDIKPNNIKLTAEGKIILLDFGLAKGSAVTIVGGMSGYSPIEQVHRTGTDPRSDIYALGTTLFHLLTDQHPYTALNRFQEIHEQSLGINPENDGIISLKPDPQMTVAEINPQVPPVISKIVMKAMALMPNDRFQSVEEMKFAFLKAKQTLDASTTRQVINNVAGKTNIDELNDWDKAKPLFDDDEESLGHWKVERNEEDEHNEHIEKIEKIDSFVSFVPQKVGNSEFENDPTEVVETGDLSATVSSVATFGKDFENEITEPSFAANLSPTILSPEEPIPIELPVFEKNDPPKKIGKRIIPMAVGGIMLVLLISLGTLAWYLTASNPSKTNIIKPTAVNEIPLSPPEITEKPKDPIQVSKYSIGKNGKFYPLDESYQFAENEEFKLGVTSPQDGFLYIVSRNNQSKAILAYPDSEQDNSIKKDLEIIFPQKVNFELRKETPSETWVYFIVVLSREDDLAKRIRKTLDNEKEKSLSISKVSELFAELDKLADDSAKNIEEKADSANKPAVVIVKLQKKT